MKTYTCKNIRNIALAGHGGSGKTSVAEGLLYKCGEIERMGRVSDGNSVCDYDPEEIKRRSGRHHKGLQRGNKARQGDNVRCHPYGRRKQQLLQVP